MDKMTTCKACGKEIAKSAKACPQCGAKNKKAPIGCLVVLILFLLVGACSAGGTDTPETTGPAAPVVQTQPVETTAPVETVPETTAPLGSLDNPYTPGMYKVGSDLEPGEYLVVAATASGAYWEITSDSSGTFDSIVANDNVDTFGFLTVDDGQYLTLNRGLLVKADGVHAPGPDENGMYGEGTYRVGIDIPAGEYKVTAISDRGCYIEVCSDSYGVFDSIISNDNIDTTGYISVKDGNYLTVNRGEFTPVE